MPKKSLFALLLLGFLVINLTASEIPDILMIADFNTGNQNALGGYFNKFERDTSTATVDLTRSIFRGDDGKSLEIVAKKGEDGFCGAWIQFFDFRSENRKYLDASPYTYLSFWVKGKQGGEEFSVKIADRKLIEIEDSTSVGKINRLLPNGITQEWQEVQIPLNRLVGADQTQLGGLTFDFNFPGNHTIYVDDIVLKKSKDTVVPATRLMSEDNDLELVRTQHRISPPRTMWVWTVFEILENKNNEQETLFAACERENVNRLWLQIPTCYEPDVDLAADVKNIRPPEFKITLRLEDKLRAFIREAHAKGIRIEGLDGYPEFAQKPYHFIPLAIVDAIIDYNNRVEPEERFDGVHFDNEPYLIIGWHDKERREQILKEFLELNIECQRRIHENSDMKFGVDVPFWWNAADPTTEGAIGDVTFNGERKPAVYFCIDLLDNIGIMNYRDTTYGVDGIISHADPILEYAEKAGKDCVYVGLEVFQYMPTEVWFPLGLPREAFHEALKNDAAKLRYLSRINGFRTQLIDDGANMHVGIELPFNPDEATQKKIKETVVEIARCLGIKSKKELSERDSKKMIMFVKKEISKNPEWRDYKPAEIIDSANSEEYPGFKAVSIMLGKTTFADESYDELERQLSASERELVDYPAYAGIAIHYFKVFDEKFQQQKASTRAQD
jgi:hypothetical protein